jgi:hypothetical protein
MDRLSTSLAGGRPFGMALTNQRAMSRSPNIRAAKSIASIIESEFRAGSDSPLADHGELQTSSALYSECPSLL